MTEKLDPRQVVTFGWMVTGLLALTVVGMGCGRRSYVSHTRSDPTGLAPDHAVALVLTGDDPGYEERLASCVRSALKDGHPTVQVLPPDGFRQVASSDLVLDQPLGGRSWRTLAADPAFRKRIAPLRLPYLISVTRFTEARWDYVPLFRVDHVTTLRAEVLDLGRGTVAGSVRLVTVGRAPPPFTFVRTESQACEDMGIALAKFLTAEDATVTKGEPAAAKASPEN